MTVAQSPTALVLVGFQNDYFSPQGALHGALEDAAGVGRVLCRTMALIEALAPTSAPIISTPIHFTPDYGELRDPIGILKAIKDHGAFRRGTFGARAIPELQRYGSRITEIPGKRGLDAFSETDLDAELRRHGVRTVMLAGVVTSLCIDSTARAAFEKGYRPVVLSDCTCGRTAFEQKFYCETVFPLYAQVMDSSEAARTGVAA